jgi:hypothetical protein
LQVHDVETMLNAVLKTTKKYRQLRGAMDQDYLIRYTSSVANSLKRQEEHAEGPIYSGCNPDPKRVGK